ncbi:MAG: serine hydrolase domain-containing protein, partial [Pseudomonadota bacterium]
MMERWSVSIVVLLAVACGQTAAGAVPAAEEVVQAIEAYVQPYLDAGAFDGVVLIAEGEAVTYRGAFGKASYELDVPMGSDQRFRIASLSKQITQALIARFVDRGDLDLDAPVAEVLPEFAHGGQMSTIQLIEHRAGVPHTNTLEWMDTTKTLMLDAIVERLSASPLDFEPGTKRRYSNGGYAILAAMLERLSGMPYGQLVRDELARYPSLGHESPFALVPRMASRYAPGERFGTRSRATTYHVWNRVGGGSLYGNADDVFRLFFDAYHGRLVSAQVSERFFARPTSAVLVTGRSPGALAQIWFDPTRELTVLTLSSNSGWPASFTQDLARLYVGEPVQLVPVEVATAAKAGAAERLAGTYAAQQFAWQVDLVPMPDGHLVWVHDELRTTLAATRAGAWYLPIYDWLCDLAGEGGATLACRQR